MHWPIAAPSQIWSSIARTIPRPSVLLIMLISTLGTAHILIRTSTYGAAVGRDSVAYLSSAMNLLPGEGIILRAFPPFFPRLLSFISLFGIEPVEAGRLVNATAFGLTILASGLWLNQRLRSRLLVLVTTLAIMAAYPLNHFSSTFMSDPLFVLFTLLALVQLESFLTRRAAWAPLLLAAVFAALAAVTRYPGIAIIFTGVLLLLVHRGPSLALRLKHAAVFGAVSSIPLIVVLAGVWAVFGTLGGRGPSHLSMRQSFADSLSQVPQVINEWVVPPNAPDWTVFLLWTAVGAAVLAAAVVFVCYWRLRVSGKSDPRYSRQYTGARIDGEVASAPQGLSLMPSLPFCVFVLVYMAFLVGVVPFAVRQGIDSRYLVPVYAPLLLAVAFLLDRFLCLEAIGRAAGWMASAKWAAASIILIGVLASVGFSTQQNLRLTAEAIESGYFGKAYNTAYWANSKTLEFVVNNRLDGELYSNGPSLIWFKDRAAARDMSLYRPIEGDKISDLIRWIEDGSGAANVVWLHDHYAYRFDYDDWDIRFLPGVETVAEFSDGVVFRVTRGQRFDQEAYRARRDRFVDNLIEEAGEPVARSIFDVYLVEGQLVYHKEPCTEADTKEHFFLHVSPTDVNDLPEERRQYGFANLDFRFNLQGRILDGKCVASVPLPEYAIASIKTGQFIIGDGRVWGAEVSLEE